MMFRSKQYRKNTKSLFVRGFSLMELLAVMSIFTILSSVILVRHSRFRGDALITTLAYEVALAVRSAQVYGLGVRELTGSGFVFGHGIHFNKTDTTSFFLFADLSVPPNNRWDAGTDRLVERFTLGSGNTIADFCAVGVPENSCAFSGSASWQADSLDIAFLRPDPEAVITPTCSGGQCVAAISGATVTVRSAHGITRMITISPAGQISVQ